MNKLISLLMALLMMFVGVAALAEAPETNPVAEETVTPESDTQDEAIIGGADEATGIVVASEGSSLLMEGLLVTVIGLAGVFLVLILFFLMIKLMGMMLK